MTKKLDILSSGICLLKRIHLDVTANGHICQQKRGGMGGGMGGVGGGRPINYKMSRSL